MFYEPFIPNLDGLTIATKNESKTQNKGCWYENKYVENDNLIHYYNLVLRGYLFLFYTDGHDIDTCFWRRNLILDLTKTLSDW